MKTLKDKIDDCIKGHIKENNSTESILEIMKTIVGLLAVIETFYQKLYDRAEKEHPNTYWEAKGIFRSQVGSANRMTSDIAGMMNIHKRAIPEADIGVINE
jgi:hypothetical protein